MKKLIILSLLLLATPAYATSWDTAGNVVTPTDFIGTTNTNAVLKFKIAGQEIYRIQPDGMRFMQPQITITDSNGVTILSHYTSNGCTGIFGNVNKILNICSDGFTFTNGAVNFKTNYTIASNTAYTLTATDDTVEMESGDFILPDAIPANKGKSYTMINTGAGDIAVRVYSGWMIGNFKQEAQYIIPSDEYVTVRSNGSMWRVVSKS